MVLTEIELLMRAWCEEHARQLFRLTVLIRCAMVALITAAGYFGYKMIEAADRRVRGADHMPSGLRIGSVVYFDMTVAGRDAGRIVIGLLTENCPLYCEYFHRRCTGNGGHGESFRGMKLQSVMVRNAAIFGDGAFMQHGIQGYNPEYLPTEYKAEKPWRGALSSIAYGSNKESPNFAIHMCSGDYAPQVFGIVIGGYEVLEHMNRIGCSHGSEPKQEWLIDGCGELCTLDKTKIVPMPWQLYDSVSAGYDEEKFGPKSILDTVNPAARSEQNKESETARSKWRLF